MSVARAAKVDRGTVKGKRIWLFEGGSREGIQMMQGAAYVCVNDL